MQLRREHQNLQEFQNNYDDIEVALGGPAQRDTGMCRVCVSCSSHALVYFRQQKH